MDYARSGIIMHSIPHTDDLQIRYSGVRDSCASYWSADSISQDTFDVRFAYVLHAPLGIADLVIFDSLKIDTGFKQGQITCDTLATAPWHIGYISFCHMNYHLHAVGKLLKAKQKRKADEKYNIDTQTGTGNHTIHNINGVWNLIYIH